MKRLLLLSIILLIGFYSQAQIVDIPDANFKDALVNTDCVDTNNDGIPDNDVDTNDDGEIQVSEAEAVIGLFVDNKMIDSMEGIQSFINIEVLNCSFNSFISIDLSQNSSMEYFYCTSSSLTELDVSMNLNLIELHCQYGLLSYVEVSNNANLEYFDCSGDGLTSVDVTNNPNLLELHCDSSELPSLDISQNLNLIGLHCGGCSFQELNISNNPNIESLWLGFSDINTIDLSNNPNLIYFNGSLSQFTHLDFSNNPSIETLYLFSSQLVDLNIANGNNGPLYQMMAYSNPNLNCIQVDDVGYANNNPLWQKDSWSVYSEDCNLGIEENAIDSFSIYPNPVKDILNIESQQSIETVKIYSLQGQLIKESSKSSLDVSQLTAGMYFAQVTIEGKTVTKKFIKE